MTMHRLVLAFVVTAMALTNAQAQEDKKSKKDKQTDQEAIHKELRAFRDSLTDAVLKKDFEKQLEHVTEDVVVTWQNGEVVRGKKALREFMERNVAKSQAFRGYKEKPAPSELTILYGDDTGISYGTSVGLYHAVGKDFELKNMWSAAVVKVNGRWLISNYHVSANILDNPLLNTAKTLLYWVGGIALVVGLAVGWIVTKVWGRGSASSAPLSSGS